MLSATHCSANEFEKHLQPGKEKAVKGEAIGSDGVIPNAPPTSKYSTASDRGELVCGIALSTSITMRLNSRVRSIKRHQPNLRAPIPPTIAKSRRSVQRRPRVFFQRFSKTSIYSVKKSFLPWHLGAVSILLSPTTMWVQPRQPVVARAGKAGRTRSTAVPPEHRLFSSFRHLARARWCRPMPSRLLWGSPCRGHTPPAHATVQLYWID